jgi:putative tricarboxylic transport membrane protein
VRAPAGQLALAAGVVASGAFVLWGSFNLPTGGGYAQVGPGVVPRIVGAGLLLLGALLVREVLTGGFRGLDEAEERRLGMDWRAFGWIGAGLVGHGLLVERLGFVIASTLLFVVVAHAFGSRRWALNAISGGILAAAVFAVFNYGLGLNLPAGVLKGMLP